MFLKLTKQFFSALHALFIFKESIFYLYTGNTDVYMNSLTYSILYFSIDMVFMIVYDKNNRLKREMILHHLIPIYIISPYIYYNNYIDEPYLKLMACLFLSEASTIPLNICLIMDKIGKTRNIVFKISGGLVLLLFIPFRLMMHPFVFYKLFMMNDYYYSGLQMVLLLLNYYWFGKLFRKFLNSI